MKVALTLRSRLLRHVIVPLALTWLVGALLALAVARYFTQQAFDRALLDDAYAVASHVRHAEDGGLTLGLSSVEMGNLLFDQNENLYFAVYQDDGHLLAGHAGLQLPVGSRLAVTPFFTETPFQNRSLRAVVLERSKPAHFTVVVAQTTRVQDRLFQRLLFISLVPQLLLVIWLAWWLRRAIQKDVQPLMDLEHAVAQRDVRDLTPLAISTRTLDVQKLGESINALLHRIDQSVRGQKEFAGNVAHELRTPLSGIRALAEYGLAQSDPQVWREQLRSIAQSQERASHLIDQLLALALAQEAQQVLQPQPLALDEVVRDSLMRHLHRADALSVDLGVDFVQGLDTPVWVLAQRALLEGALDNLIDNALRYGRSQDGESHITVSIEQTYEHVTLSVTDNGAGVPPEKLKQISQRWVQGAAGEALKAGMGLGLAIVGSYAKLLGARVGFKATEPHGFSVSVAFPQSVAAIKPADATS